MKEQKYINACLGNNEIENWVKTTLAAHLRKNPENQGEIEHIIDFLHSHMAPRRLQKMSYKQAKERSEKWVAALKKKGNDIIETEADIETVHQFKGGGRLVKLITKSAYAREGFLMSHCVSSYHGREGYEIYSLRDHKNQPHATFGVIRKGKTIEQVKGKGDGPIHPKYIKPVIKCLEILGMELRESELSNLGYVDLRAYGDEFYNWVNPRLKGAKYMFYKGKEYLFLPSVEK